MIHGFSVYFTNSRLCSSILENVALDIAQWEFSNPDSGDADHFAQLYRELDQLRKKPEGALPASLLEVIDATSDASDDCDTITYTLSGFANLLEFEVFQMVHADIRMKRCKNCGTYFIVEKSNQEYCHASPRALPSSARKSGASVCTAER